MVETQPAQVAQTTSPWTHQQPNGPWETQTAPVTEEASADDWMQFLPPEYLKYVQQRPVESTSLATEFGSEDAVRVLTIEEQREVAFKVVFFFIGLIAASFGVLYVYHKMTQANVKSEREKQSL